MDIASSASWNCWSSQGVLDSSPQEDVGCSVTLTAAPKNACLCYPFDNNNLNIWPLTDYEYTKCIPTAGDLIVPTPNKAGILCYAYIAIAGDLPRPLLWFGYGFATTDPSKVRDLKSYVMNGFYGQPSRPGVLENCPNGPLGIKYHTENVYDCPTVLIGEDVIGTLSNAGYLTKAGSSVNPATTLAIRFSHQVYQNHIGYYLAWGLCTAGINATLGTPGSKGIHLGMLVPFFLDENKNPLGDFTYTTSPSQNKPHYSTFDYGIIGRLETPEPINDLVGKKQFTVLL